MRTIQTLALLLAFAVSTSDTYAEGGKEYIELNEVVLSDQKLANTRGGFRLSKDYTVHIGLSVTSAINGDDVFTTHIADLVIHNGVLSNLDNLQLQPSIINVIQSGTGNHLNDIHKVTAQPTESATLNSSIINIIQNTQNNSILGISTVIDIEAQASQVIDDIKATQQLSEAMLNHLY